MSLTPLFNHQVIGQSYNITSDVVASGSHVIADTTSLGGRLYETEDGTIHLAEKPVAYVIGERIVAPVIDRTCTMVLAVFASMKQVALGMHHFQFLPGAAAQETHGNNASEASWFESIYDYIMPSQESVLSDRTYDLVNYLDMSTYKMSVIQALVHPPSELKWFQEGMLNQMNKVLNEDFLDALRHSYFANLHLLHSSMHLVSVPNAYSKILEIHGKSFNLYSRQIGLNRSVELSLIKYARTAFATVSRVKHLIDSRRYGSFYSRKTQSALKELAKQQEEHYIKMLTSIGENYDKFFKEIKQIQQEIQPVLDQLTNSKEGVKVAMQLLQDLEGKRKKLLLETSAKEKLFKHYQETKGKEYEGRKEEENGGKIGIDAFSISWSKKETVTPDLGSKDLQKELGGLRKKIQQREEEIEASQQHLAKRFQEVLPTGQNQDDLKRASNALAAGMSSIERLKSAIDIKKSNTDEALAQVRENLNILQVKETLDVDEFRDYIDVLVNNIMDANALWIQFQKQPDAIKMIRNEESNLKSALILDLLNQNRDGLAQLEAQLAQGLTPEGLQRYLPSNKELLDSKKDEL